MLNPFVWKADIYSVGIKIIDEQHEKLFKIGSDINETAYDYDGDDQNDRICSLIEELVDYTNYHFTTEEDLFEKYNYPNAESHKEEHKEFIETLKDVDYTSMKFLQENY